MEHTSNSCRKINSFVENSNIFCYLSKQPRRRILVLLANLSYFDIHPYMVGAFFSLKPSMASCRSHKDGVDFRDQRAEG